MNDLFAAISLVLIIEGLVLLSSPNRINKLLKIISEMKEKNVRKLGFISVLAGITLLFIIRA